MRSVRLLPWRRRAVTCRAAQGSGMPEERAEAKGAVSSAGRASRLHREGRRFEPVTAHHARRAHVGRRKGSRSRRTPPGVRAAARLTPSRRLQPAPGGRTPVARSGGRKVGGSARHRRRSDAGWGKWPSRSARGPRGRPRGPKTGPSARRAGPAARGRVSGASSAPAFAGDCGALATFAAARGGPARLSPT